MNLMREVELQEKAAEQANVEAARGGSDILVRVEEYKTMLAHAKEANDMVIYVNKKCRSVLNVMNAIFTLSIFFAACRRSLWRKGNSGN